MHTGNKLLRSPAYAAVALLITAAPGLVLAADSIEAGSTAPAAISNELGNELGNELADAFKSGTFNVGFRYRYEFVDQDAFDKDANASTLRTRLVYKSGKFRDTFLTLNMDDVHTVVTSNYNSTRNGKTEYPPVADPKGTDLNLASLTYTGLEDGTVIVGRQRIIRENARFIGNVGWRQNEQTYDSAAMDYAVTEKLQVFYAYVNQVQRVFGPDDGTPMDDYDSNSNLLDAVYTVSPALRVAGYGYWLDLKNDDAFSSQTMGLRLTGTIGEADDAPVFSYAAEYAWQQDYKNNPNNYDESYYHLVAGADGSQFGVKGGYEVLGGSGEAGESFQTPLATLHKFNGLADLFLTTPAAGLQDAYVAGSAKGWGGKYSLVYHDFSQASGSGDYGSEWDFIATWPFLEHYSVLAGFGLFDSDDGYASDTNKVWFMFSADF